MNRRALLGASLLLLFAVRIALAVESVAVIKVDGAIGPATASYIGRGIDEAHGQGAQCVIVVLDTPGGLLDSTKTIVQKFYSSPIPTVVYVAPAGATATSAGCFITLAADIAAMAPSTTIGAAHPVQIGGNPGGGDQKPDDTMKEKLENYAISYVESIAARRNRNVDWARSAVKQSASISAEKALELKVVDVIAADQTELLSKIDGRVINGRTLKTAGARIIPIEMSVRESIFQTLWRPEVMFILMLVAVYGIIGELNNPGAILPGVVGAIALVLALYMSAILPVNTAGLALIGLAFILFVIDVFAPSHGVLTIGGIASFFIGALMLFDRGDPAFRLSLGYIIPAVILTALFFFFVMGKGLSAQRLPVKVGKETLLGKTTRALTVIDQQSGKVFIEGEYWNAQSDSPVAEGQLVQITGIVGLTLIVIHKPPTIEGKHLC